MPSFELSPDLLAAIAGAVLSLIFSFTPGLSTWFAGLLPEIKRLIMLGLLLVSTAVIYAGTCVGIFVTDITCDQAGILRLVWMLIAAVMANQSTYAITPQTTKVRMAATKARETDYHRIYNYLG